MKTKISLDNKSKISLIPTIQASHRHSITDETVLDYQIEGTCPITKKPWSLWVNKIGYINWISGELIQDALSELSDDERELILSGISSEGWETFS